MSEVFPTSSPEVSLLDVSNEVHHPQKAKNATSTTAHQHNKLKPKIKPTQKVGHLTAVAPLASLGSVSKVTASTANVTKPASKPLTRPKPLPKLLLPSYTSNPLPPLVSHDISISDSEHDDESSFPSSDDPPSPACAFRCCSRAMAFFLDGRGIRMTVGRTRTGSGFTSKQDRASDDMVSAALYPSLDVRIPYFLLLLLLVLAGCWAFVASPLAHDGDLMGFLHGHAKWPRPPPLPPGRRHLHSGMEPPSLRRLYLNEIPDAKNASLVTSDSSSPKDENLPVNPMTIPTETHAFLSTPYLVVATTPTGATGPGLHVPCQWLEERYGNEEQFAQLRKTIDLVRKGIDPSAPLPPSAATAKEVVGGSDLSTFVRTERSQVNSLLDSVGIYCQTEEIRDRCEFDGIVNDSANRTEDYSSVEISRLHQWLLSLPEDARFEDEVRTSESATSPPMVVFNKLTGAIATLNCRNKVRYSAPFSNNEQASVYVEPNFNALPTAYAEFIAKRCTKEARDAVVAASAQKAKVHHNPSRLSQTLVAAANHTTTPPAPAAPIKKWVDPLIPLLPPVCSAASFTRPSLARACLRNSRIIGFGDSTTQELLLTLIDFLEQDDGEDPTDLTRMLVDDSTVGRARTSQQTKEWMPPNAGSDGLTRYFWIEHWGPPDSCYMAPCITFVSRMFSTARFPTPYLAAFNITITLQWNLDEEPCNNYRGPNYASSVGMYRKAYRWLRESCLPDNAVEIANKYRRRPDGTYRSITEYIDHVNSIFHNRVRDGQFLYKEDPPPSGCTFPYLPLEESTQFTHSEWQAHLATVPSFDYAMLNMGAHQTRAWGNADGQRGEAGYSYNEEQYHHAVESHVHLVQSIARNVVIRECSWRTDAHFGRAVPAINVILREVALEAQTRALQRDLEIAQLMDAARRATVAGKPFQLVIEPVHRSVSWLPTYFHTILMKKDDAVHCSFKAIAGGNGVNGIRTPFCYSLAQRMIQLFCSNK